MRVIFIKEFAKHAVGNIIDTDTNTARYLVGKGVAEAKALPAKDVEEDKVFDHDSALKALTETEVKDISYPYMKKLVAALGLTSNGATKPALTKALNDFKKTL